MNSSFRPLLTDVELEPVVVVTPALNEEFSLPFVLKDLPRVANVFVVDNGCRDRTPEIARELGASVVDQPHRGYGAACLAGIAAIKEWAKHSGHCSDPVVVFFGCGIQRSRSSVA